VGNAKQGAVAAKVGGHVEAACRKCDGMTTHIVLAMVAGAPSKVECRVCHGTHQYKPSMTAKATSSATRAPRASTARASRTPEPNPADVWASAMRSARGETIAYSPSGRYVVGAKLKHPTFGEGVVTRLGSSTVCEVVFVAGMKKLIMGASSAPGRKPGA